MIHEHTFKVVDFNGAKGLVYLGDLILAYRRDYKTDSSPGRIDLPGGGRENNESPFDTFKREVKEEFGLDIDGSQIHFSCTVPSVTEPSKKSFFMVAKTQFKPEDVVFGNEGLEWMLMDTQEFIHRPDGSERQQNRVTRYLTGDLVSE